MVVPLAKRDTSLPAGAAYSTVTTEVNGVYGTYLEVVYTSTLKPASTYVVTTTIVDTTTLANGDITTVSSVVASTTTKSAVYATGSDDTTTTTSTTSTTTSSTITSAAQSTTTTAAATSSTGDGLVQETDMVSWSAYATEVADGTCYVYYAEDDDTSSYTDDAPYTTLTVTSVVATVTLS